MNIDIKFLIVSVLLGITLMGTLYSQNEQLQDIVHVTIAQGTDSPIEELQIVCFNKFFNKDYLPKEFQKKYNLDDTSLYKKKMLVEIFHSDKAKKGLDSIELVGIKENDNKLVIEYNLVNSNAENDEMQLAPFLIVQVPKSKKEVKFIVNGVELGKTSGVYMD